MKIGCSIRGLGFENMGLRFEDSRCARMEECVREKREVDRCSVQRRTRRRVERTEERRTQCRQGGPM